ncbi:MAG: hypothetical protein HXO58_08025 [Rothia mucilaginosa]|uniref:Putative phage ssDNA-binding domain-containing protein n=1 Tax=Rothia mucilaginosa TaxID=43675 RepID=A0A930KZC6_9MICC|nr:hypothetical protein [Rothia mucilaginosa]MBF1659765.1 hypothetical protein [Rothia mucilaginosa]
MNDQPKRPDPIIIEGARIKFKNFAGEARQYNPAGQRNFVLCLPDELARQLTVEGWNVKWKPGRHPEDPDEAQLVVKVKYNESGDDHRRDPIAYLIQGRRKIALDGRTVATLDRLAPLNIDLVVRPYVWDINGNVGITAYLDEIYYTAVEGLSSKYADYEEVQG